MYVKQKNDASSSRATPRLLSATMPPSTCEETTVNIQVLLRCRPFSQDEIRNNILKVVTCNELQKEVTVSHTIAGKQIDSVFKFDKVFGPCAQQNDLYEQAIAPIVNEVLEGFNCTVFAYGQTGTGKTHTMEGECRRAKNAPKGQLPVDAGIIPRAVVNIFESLECQYTEYSVKVTFLELYNEEITDLLAREELSKISLADKQKKQLVLMNDDKGEILVRGLVEEVATCVDEIFSLLERGFLKRRTARTLLNKQSSRSHSLISITIHIKETTLEGEYDLIKCGKLNLVDLAGSENISRSGVREGTSKDIGQMNKSLLTLGRVITALVEHRGHIPYRDSKLTRLLRDSLGGSTKTCIIATVSPSAQSLEETLSTLDYAYRAKDIKNRPEVKKKKMNSTLIKDLSGEVDRLKAELYAPRENLGVYIPNERYYQEMAERKKMAEEIERMSTMLERSRKQYDDLQRNYAAKLRQNAELKNELDATKERLDYTNKTLAMTREELQHACYQLKKRDEAGPSSCEVGPSSSDIDMPSKGAVPSLHTGPIVAHPPPEEGSPSILESIKDAIRRSAALISFMKRPRKALRLIGPSKIGPSPSIRPPPAQLLYSNFSHT